MNHLLTSTGINVIENRIIEPNAGWFDKESNNLFVGNIYPFMFLGCGKMYSLEQCVDFSIQYATDLINRKIDAKDGNIFDNPERLPKMNYNISTPEDLPF